MKAALEGVFGDRRLVLGSSPAFLAALKDLFVVAFHDIAVLVEGESGTGKELFARAIHNLSPRKNRSLVAVNCAALPRDLLESELFGHIRGAFTGAREDKQGLVEKAQQGTLFLDEVASLHSSLQAKMLRFLDSGEYRRVGESGARNSDVRVIAACNISLREAAENGDFRQDLYFRLSAYPIVLPPLRDRPEDVPALVEHFLKVYAEKFGVAPPRMGPAALESMSRYSWPGNVRELQNTVMQMVLRQAGRQVESVSLGRGAAPAEAAAQSIGDVELISVPFQQRKKEVIDAFEKRYLRALLKRHQGNVTQAAKSAGKHRRALNELLNRHGLDASGYRRENS